MRVKKKLLSFVLCICMVLQVAPNVKAADKEGAANWKISSISLGHTEIEFELSGIDKAQSATLIIYNSKDEVVQEIAVNIESTQVSVKIPDGTYLKSGNYYLSVKDLAGNVSEKKQGYVWNHGTFFHIIGGAYPNCLIGKDHDGSISSVTATVGFEKYIGVKDENGQILIEYPTQALGTKIYVECADEYGCTSENTWTVENEYLRIPSISVWKDSVGARYPNMSDDERIAVLVEGNIYYSSYGADYIKYVKDLVTFPQVSSDTKSVELWMESKNGSVSKKETYEIKNCNLNECISSNSARPERTTGTIKTNDYGDEITKVETVISGIHYECEVDKDGKFSLSYPQQKDYTRILLRFFDRHGCSSTKEESVFNTLAGTKVNASTMLLGTTAYVPYAGVRIGIEIKGTKYYSDYSTKNDQILTVSYPKQAEGTSVNVWYEMENTSKTEVVSTKLYNIKYKLRIDARTSSAKGFIGESYNFDIYAKIGDKSYKCELEKLNPKKDGDWYYSFTVTYPKQKVGSTIQFVVEDSNGYDYSEEVTLKNISPKIKINTIDTGSNKINGTTTANSKIVVKVNNKIYSGKANSYGKFSIKAKQFRQGTKVTVHVTTPEGYTASKSTKVKKAYGYVEVCDYIFKNSKQARIAVNYGQKNDLLKVQIGSKTYTKKIKVTKKNQKITIGIGQHFAGTKVKVTLYDKFGKKKDSSSDMIYFGNSIYVGMSAKNAELTTWGRAVRKYDWGIGYVQWVFQSGSSTLYVYIKGGVVTLIQKSS